MMRLLISGLVGGILMFIWGFLAHNTLPLNDVGIKTLPNEPVTLSTFKTNISEPGFYFFPGMDSNKTLTTEEQNAWAEKYKAGPTGVLIYNPTGENPFSINRFLIEFVSDTAAVLVVAFILSLIAPSFSKRVLVATLIGLTAWMSVLISYWNWYGFPTIFILSEAVDQIVGWFLIGLVVSLILGWKRVPFLKRQAAVST